MYTGDEKSKGVVSANGWTSMRTVSNEGDNIGGHSFDSARVSSINLQNEQSGLSESWLNSREKEISSLLLDSYSLLYLIGEKREKSNTEQSGQSDESIIILAIRFGSSIENVRSIENSCIRWGGLINIFSKSGRRLEESWHIEDAVFCRLKESVLQSL